MLTSVRPPGSKSITNRALVCAALAEGDSTLTGALDSEDTRVMIAALRSLGIVVEAEEGGRTLRVEGCGGTVPASRADLFVANSGTTMRFLTAMVALGRGEYRLDGVARMRERPIGDLVDALKQLGAVIKCEGEQRCPPIVVNARGLAGGRATIRGDISSQFLSGVLMAAPYAARPVELAVEGALVSIPYVDMTLEVMRSFAAAATAESDYASIRVDNARRYAGRQYAIEPDASAASYFFAAAAIIGGRITVEGLNRDSLQGDLAFCECLRQMGARVDYGPDSTTVEGGPLGGVDVDMNAISDTVQTLSVVALFADGPTRIRNVAHIRHKETDRIGATATELRKLGAEVEEFDDGLVIHPPKELHGAEIDTYNDHRMAMSFALAGLRTPNVVIRNPECTAKTYPAFFSDLERVVRGATKRLV
ncbi:MAG TPA: 3-phosphoshikimate 1-carboxyvinyltransferase [Lacipirellula sp.]